MLNDKQLKVIDTYVNEEYFYKNRLISYLDTHNMVGNEIFSYVNKTTDCHTSTSRFLDNELGFIPIAAEKFVQRLPFYYYLYNLDDNKVGNLDCLLGGLYSNRTENIDIEKLYVALEKAFYIHKIPLEDIMDYIIDQTGYVNRTDVFFQWVHYLDLCKTLKWNDLMPDNFIYAYNNALEHAGEEPIIYEVEEQYSGEYFYRNCDEIVFEGQFPCNKDGQPVMKWIGIKAKNPASIICNGYSTTKHSRLIIKLKPNTLISVLNCYNNTDTNENIWYQIYAGPQLMKFDYTILKDRRMQLGYTQQRVADAIDTSIRTYQKWESGTTTPDGCNLLRLMNFLDITNIQDLILYI